MKSFETLNLTHLTLNKRVGELENRFEGRKSVKMSKIHVEFCMSNLLHVNVNVNVKLM